MTKAGSRLRTTEAATDGEPDCELERVNGIGYSCGEDELSPSFPHLGLARWPFVVVPQPNHCDYLADREQLKKDVDDLLVTMSRREGSSIHIFWAWFGAGKTHTLYYMQNLASKAQDEYGRPNGLVPIYTELPRSPGGFVDVYKTFADALDVVELADAYLELRTSPSGESAIERIRRASVDLDNALQVLATGTAQTRTIAEHWIKGDKLPISEFREAGITKRIATPEEAVKVFSALIEILARSRAVRGARVGRVVWLLDEFQRISSTSAKVLREINNGLHSAFNSCPTGLSLVLSFSGRPEKALPDWFSPELRDRIGITKVLVLPPLRRDTALKFLADVLSHNRSAGARKDNHYFPFTEAACIRIIDWIANNSELKPRAIMQAFSQVLEAADIPMEMGEISEIDEAYVAPVLEERVTLAMDEA